MIWLMIYMLCWILTSLGVGFWVARDQDGVLSIKDILVIVAVNIVWPLVFIGGGCYWVAEESQNINIDVSRWVGLGKEEEDKDEQ